MTGGAVQTSSRLRAALHAVTGEIWYLRVDAADERHLAALEHLDLSGVIDAVSECSGRPERLLPHIREFGHVLSGRHHLNLFAYYLGIPVTVLCGNTHKNEGTREGFEAAGDDIFRLARKNGLEEICS